MTAKTKSRIEKASDREPSIVCRFKFKLMNTFGAHSKSSENKKKNWMRIEAQKIKSNYVGNERRSEWMDDKKSIAKLIFNKDLLKLRVSAHVRNFHVQHFLIEFSLTCLSFTGLRRRHCQVSFSITCKPIIHLYANNIRNDVCSLRTTFHFTFGYLCVFR